VDQTGSAHEEEQMFSMLTHALTDDRVAQWRRDAAELTLARQVAAANRANRARGARNGRRLKARDLRPACDAAPTASGAQAASAALCGYR
jgi:hypothetical protein